MARKQNDENLSIPEIKKHTIGVEAVAKKHYFDNLHVESLVQRYVSRGCVDVELRDEIMSHMSELLRMTIRVHGLSRIYNNKDGTSFSELFMIGWVALESCLYKFDYTAGHKRIFNMLCVAPDTNVMTNDGICTMEQAFNSAKFIYGNGLHKINGFIKKPITKTFKFTTKFGHKLECSPEHKLLVLDGQDEKWKEGRDIKCGDLVKLQYRQNYFICDDNLDDITLTKPGPSLNCKLKQWESPKYMTEDLAYLMGLYVAEGYYTNTNFNIINADSEVIDFCLHNKLGLKFKYYKNCMRIVNCCQRFSEFMDKLGFESDRKAKDKIIPQRLLKCSKGVLIALLRGMYDGDGSSSVYNGQVAFTSTSKTLINQIRMLLLNFGINTKLSEDKRRVSFFGVNGKEYFSDKQISYQITCSSNDSKLFYKLIGFNIRRKQDKEKFIRSIKDLIYVPVGEYFNRLMMKYGCGSLNKSSIRNIKYCKKSIQVSTIFKYLKNWEQYNNDNDYVFIKKLVDDYNRDNNATMWVPIVKIEDAENCLYDVEVNTDDHLYMANGLIVHNSQVARTSMLAYIKKESRHRTKAYNDTYKKFIADKDRYHRIDFTRFIEEVRGICNSDDDYLKIVDCIEHLLSNDPKPYDGLIYKILNTTKLPKSVIHAFFEFVRGNGIMFTDSPENQKHKYNYNLIQDKASEFESEDFD